MPLFLSITRPSRLVVWHEQRSYASMASLPAGWSQLMLEYSQKMNNNKNISGVNRSNIEFTILLSKALR